jgi:hypothetical protein
MSCNEIGKNSTDTTHVPTAAAVWNALQMYGGGGSGGAGFPNYGSAGAIGEYVTSGTVQVATGTAGPNGGWLMVGVAAGSGGQGCVGVKIGDAPTFPAAFVPGGGVTLMYPVPAGATWYVYNKTGANAVARAVLL